MPLTRAEILQEAKYALYARERNLRLATVYEDGKWWVEDLNTHTLWEVHLTDDGIEFYRAYAGDDD